MLARYSHIFRPVFADMETLNERDMKAEQRTVRRRAKKPAEVQKKANQQKRKAEGKAQAFQAAKKASKKAGHQLAAKYGVGLPPEAVSEVAKAGADAYLKHLSQ